MKKKLFLAVLSLMFCAGSFAVDKIMYHRTYNAEVLKKNAGLSITNNGYRAIFRRNTDSGGPVEACFSMSWGCGAGKYMISFTLESKREYKGEFRVAVNDSVWRNLAVKEISVRPGESVEVEIFFEIPENLAGKGLMIPAFDLSSLKSEDLLKISPVAVYQVMK